ncbi:hypothetical protein BH11PAT3_BH11PAT3_3240 [soil metagenome]
MTEEKREAKEEQNVRFEEDTDVKTLLSWRAPGRPYRQKGKEYYLNALVILLFIEVIIFLFHWYLLMLAVLSLGFLSFALSSVPPREFYYRFSNQGIMVEDRFFLWSELYDFYFSKKDGSEMIHIGTKAYFPGEILLMLGDMPKEHIKQVLLKYLPYREYVKPTFTDKAGDWLENNFPLENISSKK